jgi:hypothetical protein
MRKVTSLLFGLVLPRAKSKSGRNIMVRTSIIAAASVAVLALSPSAFAQMAKYGTAAEAKAMLEKAVVAVKADKVKALAMFTKGEGGFKDRDLQPFCWDAKTGETLASTVPALVGTNHCTQVDKVGKAFGKEQCAAAIEGKFTEVSYMFPRPGETAPTSKVSFITGVAGLGCGVGYYK